LSKLHGSASKPAGTPTAFQQAVMSETQLSRIIRAKRRRPMPHYIALVSFTDQGIRDVKNSVKRLDTVEKIAAKHKVKVRDIHWTMGKYDIVVTFDAPDDAALSAFTLDNASLGNVRTETFRAYTREEFANIIKAI
jgi:uncharacterized protein with GYD domain